MISRGQERTMEKQTPRSEADDTANTASAARRKTRGRAIAKVQGQPGQEPVTAAEPREEDIRIRAYHRYLERGGGHGLDFEDWLEAERELKSGK
jgi:hypothetical protein